MINTITANELKTKGISVIDKAIASEKEAIITVRGKSKYVVISMEEYNLLREYELEAAIAESKNDLPKGNFHEGSVEDHIKRITHA